MVLLALPRRNCSTSQRANYSPNQRLTFPQEKTTTFKWYIALNAIVTYVALAVAAVIVIISGVKHNAAVANCKATYYSPPDQVKNMSGPLDILRDQSDPICQGFCWADLGMMAGLWALLFVTQSYFVWSSTKYSRSQVSDHKLYHSVYSENPEAFTMSILQSRRYNPDSMYFQNPNTPTPGGLHPNDAWDHRPSYDGAGPGPKGQQHPGGQYYDQHPGYPDQHNNQFNDGRDRDNYPFTQPHAGYVDHSNRV